MQDFKSRKPSEEKKHQEPVVSGGTSIKKKSDLKKVLDAFISEDLENIKSYIIFDVIAPIIKDGIANIIKNGTDMILYGRVKDSSSFRPAGSKISYGSYFMGSAPKQPQTQARRLDDFDDVLFADRRDAEAVLTAMYDLINQYGIATILDLYEFARAENKNFMANKYGWTDLRGASIVHVRDGWIIKMPKPMPID